MALRDEESENYRGKNYTTTPRSQEQPPSLATKQDHGHSRLKKKHLSEPTKGPKINPSPSSDHFAIVTICQEKA
jgi:hypothetical protein